VMLYNMSVAGVRVVEFGPYVFVLSCYAKLLHKRKNKAFAIMLTMSVPLNCFVIYL